MYNMFLLCDHKMLTLRITYVAYSKWPVTERHEQELLVWLYFSCDMVAQVHWLRHTMMMIECVLRLLKRFS